MAACAKCGAELNAGATFCGSCGTAVAGAAAPASGGSAPAAAAPATSSSGLQPNVAGLLCYVVWPITSIIFMVVEPYNKDKFIRFHAFQSLFFGLACFVVAIVLSVISMVLAVIPIVGWLIGLLIWLIFPLAILGLWVYLLIKAYNNEKFKLPIIGEMAEQQAEK